jgi:sporulation protein YlmC with PRC-barrel domain
MRLTDLLDSMLVDVDGEPIGRVNDVQLARDGPVQGTFGPALRVAGLLTGLGVIGDRLGYTRKGGPTGPASLAFVFHRLERRATLVPWDVVASIEPDLIRVRVRRDELPPLGGEEGT